MSTTLAPATAAPTEVTAAVDPSSARRRWVLHAAGYLAILVALFAITDLHASWSFDDGAYASQVKVLNETGYWAYPYRWIERDPNSTFAPVALSVETDTATYPYAKRPAWILLLQASTKVFGTPLGLFVPSLLGAWAAALVAWALAERLAPGRGPIGFWAVALGPLLVHSSAMWAHTWSAALGGILALVIVDVRRGATARWHLPVLLATSIVFISIRTDGLLAVLAACAGLVVAGWRPDTRRAPALRTTSLAAARAAALLVAAAITYVATDRWAHHLAPGVWKPSRDSMLTSFGFIAARWSGFVCTFLSGGRGSFAGIVLAWLSAGCSLAAGILLARGAPTRLVLAFSLVSLALLAIRLDAVARFDLAGALVALPLAAVGLGCLLGGRWHRPRTIAEVPALGVYIGLHVLAVIATQYPEGGSIDWGGRFLFPVLVPATVLAILVVVNRLAAIPEVPARVAVAAPLVVLVALPTLFGWLSANDLRSVQARTTDAMDVADGTTVIRLGRTNTRAAWRLLPDHDLLSAEVSTTPAALAMLRPGRTETVLVLGGGADRVHAPGYRRSVLRADQVVFRPI